MTASSTVHCSLFTGVQCLPPDLVGDSKPGKAEDSDQLSSSEEGSDKQDAEQQLPPAEGQHEQPIMGAAVSGVRPPVERLNQQPMAKAGMGGRGRYDPNRYRLHFESESKEEIEKRKRLAKSVPIIPVPEVSSVPAPSHTHTHTHPHIIIHIHTTLLAHTL